MIIDAHTHVWKRWPYKPEPPDAATRGDAELLIHEMDAHGVDEAIVICASISGNPDNAAHAAAQAQRFAGRLHLFPDVDCEWHDTYHAPGAAARLEAAVQRGRDAGMSVPGFTHYLRNDDDGAWLLGDEGEAFLAAAERSGLIASLSIKPHAQPALREAARRHPGVAFLCHHLGWAQADEPAPYAELQQVLDSAAADNICVKVSNFSHAAALKWDFPYKPVQRIVKALYEHYGAQRLCWGSDHPVVRRSMTYRQAIESFRHHCDFVGEDDRQRILGGTMRGLLEGTTDA